MRRVVTVGRRYYNSEGRLLLTNDGGLARSLELPSRGWVRRYRVRVHGQVDPERLAKLAAGVTVGENRYGPIARHSTSRRATTPGCRSRSEERRVGKAWARTCRYRWAPDH